MEHHCPICEFKIQCEKNNGKEREDGDDYRAVEGTHFCQYSWQPFIQREMEKQNATSTKST